MLHVKYVHNLIFVIAIPVENKQYILLKKVKATVTSAVTGAKLIGCVCRISIHINFNIHAEFMLGIQPIFFLLSH